MTKNRLIKNLIVSQLETIIELDEFQEWLQSEPISSNDRFVVFNNSFIFRENIKTKKSNKYIACKLSTTNIVLLEQCFVVEGFRLNSPFKIIVDNTSIIKKTIIQSVREELEDLGDLVFVIIGSIYDDVVEEIEVKNEVFKKIELNPTLENSILIQGDTIRIKNCDDRVEKWEFINNYCSDNSISIPDNFAGIVDSVLSSLQRKAYSRLEIPSLIDSETSYLIDRIIHVVDEHVTEYSSHLPNILNKESFNEILRISYNFVSDINKLLVLIVNICDLKPVILWANISCFVKLDLAFKELPFGFSNLKPSLKSYESLIKNARNKTFHQLFPFTKSLELEIENLDDIKLRMFSNFGNKSENQLSYKDKKLAELLLDFTRVVEEQVNDDFWIKNKQVMVEIRNLLTSVSVSLKSIRT